MRESKFRAWDKELHKMFYSDAEQFDNGLAFLIDGHFDDEEPAWMQYTGLKDENGKGIYEGDIVEAVYSVDGCHEDTEDEYGVIQWCDKKCGFNLFFKSQQESYSISYYVAFIVIGNIYENTELLEQI